MSADVESRFGAVAASYPEPSTMNGRRAAHRASVALSSLVVRPPDRRGPADTRAPGTGRLVGAGIGGCFISAFSDGAKTGRDRAGGAETVGTVRSHAPSLLEYLSLADPAGFLAATLRGRPVARGPAAESGLLPSGRAIRGRSSPRARSGTDTADAPSGEAISFRGVA